MLAQEQEGWVTKAAIEHVADMLDMPYIRALEVATFYTQFQLKPVGTRAHVQVCGTTPCMLRGAEALMDVCRAKIHHDQFHTNAEGTLSWEEVECLGACVNAPMVMIFKDTYEDLTPERLGEIIDAFAAGKGGSVPVGPQIDRIVSAPHRRPDDAARRKGGAEIDARARKRKPPGRPLPRRRRLSRQAAPAAATPCRRPRPPSRRPTRRRPARRSSRRPPVKVAPGGEKAASSARRIDPSPPTRRPTRSRRVPKQRKAARLPTGPARPSPRRNCCAASRSGRPARSRAAAKPSLADPNRPAGIERPDKPDDLKLISGVGPKIEGILHSLGIFTFAQVASWQKAERDWVDGYLNFKGRIERDDWVRQADALARGGVDEYVRVFGKKPV